MVDNKRLKEIRVIIHRKYMNVLYRMRELQAFNSRIRNIKHLSEYAANKKDSLETMLANELEKLLIECSESLFALRSLGGAIPPIVDSNPNPGGTPSKDAAPAKLLAPAIGVLLGPSGKPRIRIGRISDTQAEQKSKPIWHGCFICKRPGEHEHNC